MKSLFLKMSKLLATPGKKAYYYGMIYNFFIKVFPVKKNTILIESMLGLDFTGNPLALLKNICSDNKYAKYKIYIVCPRAKEQTIKDLLNGRKVIFLRKEKFKYAFYLAQVEYLINDVTFPIYFNRRKEQFYLNTWHGTPLKTLGRQLKKGNFAGISNTARNFMHTTLLLAPNKYTKKIFERDYMLKNVWEGNLIVDGYPRNDILVNNKKNNNENGKVDIVFMPTWRGISSDRNAASQKLIDDLIVLFEYLEENLDENINFWVKLHPLVNKSLALKNYKNIKSVPDNIDLYYFISQCDVLVTDYSSILFDFAVTERPIIIYGSDLSDYESGRGLYLSLESLPFIMTYSKEQLLDKINDLFLSRCNKFKPSNEYLIFKNEYCKNDDGCSSERICDLFFQKKQYVKLGECNKKRILIYIGPLFKNGIVSSFKNFISLVDVNKYDITILVDTKDDISIAEEYFSKLPLEIKYIPYHFKVYASPFDFSRFILYFLFKKDFDSIPKTLEKILKNEVKRVFGDAKFDVFVNYNGYSWKMALFSLGLEFPSIIYVHSEMDREISANRVADKRLLKLSYILASKVVVVRNGIDKNYCEKFYDYSDKKIYIPNPLLLDMVEKSHCDLHSAFDENTDVNFFNEIKDALTDNNIFRFVNVGRFSAEKGHFRLIDAFDQIWKNNKNCQLFIIAGHGVLEDEVKSYALLKESKDCIFVIIGSSNPFPLVRRMNTFVLSSFYEGLPMVLFEMLQLNVPIISTNIPGPAEFLNEGYGLVVENSLQGLVDGMEKALKNEIPKKEFDFDAHNRYALNQFYSAVNSVTEKS